MKKLEIWVQLAIESLINMAIPSIYINLEDDVCKIVARLKHQSCRADSFGLSQSAVFCSATALI